LCNTAQYLPVKITVLTKLFTCLLVLTSFTAYARQAETTVHTPMQDSIAAGAAKLKLIQANLDSMQARQLDRLKEESMVRDSINMVRGMDEFVRVQKKKIKSLNSSCG